MQAQANQPHVVTFLQETLNRMQDDMRQAMVNIYHYLKAERDKGVVHNHVLGPIMGIENWTGYHNAVLFDKKHLMGLTNVWNANILQAFMYQPATYRGNENPVDNYNKVLDQVFEGTEVALAYPEGSMIAAVEKSPEVVTNLLKVIDYLNFRGESIVDLYKFSPMKSYCIARGSITGEDNFEVPMEYEVDALSQQPWCQDFLKAVHFFYDMVNGFGELIATTQEDHEQQLTVMEKLTENFIRKHHKPGEEKRGILVMDSAIGTNILDDLLGFPSDFPKDGIEMALDVKPRTIKDIIQEFSAAKRFQLFKFVKKVHNMGYLEFFDMVKKSQGIGMCAYMCGNTEDLTLMRAALGTLCANNHPCLLTIDANVSCYYWIKDAYQELRKYYPDDSVFADYENTEGLTENVTAVTPERFLMNLDNLRTAAIDEVVDQINLKLNDKEFTDRNVEYEFNFNRIRVHVPINPIGGLIWEGVRAKLESQGWDATVPLNTDYDGDNTPAFHVSLMASAAK